MTVHSQGGCPMGHDPTASVTDPRGRVHGCPGLYVMDAAAFPTSVGVNPSATIAAIAEWKVEQFIQAWKDDKSWQARDRQAATRWVDAQGRSELDPLNHRTHAASSEPKLGVLGLTFEEVMRGSVSPADEQRVDFADLEHFPDHLEQFTRAENEGLERGRAIKAQLTATVDDLERLILQERATAPVTIGLKGTLTLPDYPPDYEVQDGSTLELFVPSPAAVSSRLRFFRYRLLLKARLQAESRGDMQLDGLKVLSNAPGFDLWNDTSMLYVSVSRGGRPWLRGVMRVSLEEFINNQLRSMKITGTSDPARQSWALVAFYRFFLGELAGVYVKRADLLRDLLVKALTEIHV